jgi:flagellar hook-length control protein FliK
VEDVSASEMSQSVKETVVTTVKADAPETGDEPIPTEKKMAAPVQVEDVSVNEMSQPAKEAMLKSKDDKAAPALEFDNATAESLLKVGGRPQIKNEAIAFEQGNAPVEIQPKKVEQSASVEIESEEKVTAKEPALDLESNVVIAGNEKGIADVVRKSPAVQVDPMAREVIEQITSQMKARIKSGETSISMKLNPEKLGGIEVQMTHNAQGISVSFITEQASTGQLIESQVNQLRQSLKDAGVQLANLSISQHGQSNQEGGGFRQSQHFAQTSQRDVPQVEDEGIPQRVGLTSEIDYLV